jgi:hypothetical protein
MKNTIFILLTAILIVGCKPEKDFIGKWKVGPEVYDFQADGTLIITDMERQWAVTDSLTKRFNGARDLLISSLRPERLKNFGSWYNNEKRKKFDADSEKIRNMAREAAINSVGFDCPALKSATFLFDVNYDNMYPLENGMAGLMCDTRNLFARYQFTGDGLTSKWEIRKGKLIIIDYHVWDDKALKHANVGTKTFDYTFTSDKRDLVLSDGVSPQISLKREQ